MTETILVQPGENRKVVAPNGQKLTGAFKVNPKDPYWAVALNCGDIVKADRKAATPIPAKKEGDK